MASVQQLLKEANYSENYHSHQVGTGGVSGIEPQEKLTSRVRITKENQLSQASATFT